ncbi:MAG: DUF2065 family protein [Xanthomonadales bacterium]|nr:DUF2065 family protein [Xanthomonadales bacterium]
MPADLAAALCLVLVLEGLLLFAAPGAWKRMAEQLTQVEERRLRVIGGVLVVIGLVVLRLVR